MDKLRALASKEPTGIVAVVLAAIPVIAARFDLSADAVSLIASVAALVLGALLRSKVWSPDSAARLMRKLAHARGILDALPPRDEGDDV